VAVGVVSWNGDREAGGWGGRVGQKLIENYRIDN
jgi:hypothetical protein